MADGDGGRGVDANGSRGAGERFFDLLSADGQRLAPVAYRFLHSQPAGEGGPARLATSRHYRARGYVCFAFHKPISKCLAGPEASPGDDTGGEEAERRAGEEKAAAPAISPRAPGAAAFALFACCVPVRGARRSVICDLQRQSLHFIPNGLYEILTEHRGKTTAAVKEHYAHEADEEIDEYFDFLLREELGFWCDDPESFPDLDLSWDPPERITNAILDVDAGSAHDYPAILRQLDDLGCKALEARFFHACRLGDLTALLAAAEGGRLRSIELLAGWGEELVPPALEGLAAAYQRLSGIVVHSAPPWRQHRWTVERLGTAMEYVTERIDSPRCCGKIHPGQLVVNLETFAEARQFNSCLNRKVAIDARGEIRNCPSLPRSFGNVREVSLHSALAHRDFPALWAINKDQIAVCKDCELRYVCTDCRAYLSEGAGLYSKPATCTYDPYTATWNPPAAAAAAGSAKGDTP